MLTSVHSEKTFTSNYEDVYFTISKNIKKYRKVNKMTQYDLAVKSGYSYAYIRRIEGPKCIKNFSIQTIYNISKALEIPIKNLFDNKDI